MTHRPGPGRPPRRRPRGNSHTWRVTGPPPPRRPGCPIVLASAAVIAVVLLALQHRQNGA